MQYKTLTLEMIQNNPELHEQLRASRSLLATVERCALLLKERHTSIQEELSERHPELGEMQLKCQAGEIALAELEQVLSQIGTSNENACSLDEAMAYLRRHQPPA